MLITTLILWSVRLDNLMALLANIDPSYAAALMLERSAARSSLSSWSRLCGFEPAQHHELIISKLEAVARGEIRRLAIFLPPGAAKSTYSSVLFPPWFLAQRSGASILCASCNKRLADKFGRLSRNLIDEHSKTLGYTLAQDSQAVDDWGTSNGGVYFCAGVDSRIAGHRADLGLIDDPIGSLEDADSVNIRESVWDWYEWCFVPRLKPGGSIVVISTRWHEDDLMGRLLTKQLGKWEVIKLPMLATADDPLGRQPGDRLWPEYFTQEMVDEAQSNPRKWQGPYQQDPTPESGDYFKAEWLVGYQPHNLPKALTIYVASDHACSTKEGNKNDATCLLPFGVDEGDNVWILPDIFWDRADTGKVVTEMVDIIRRRDPVAWVAETEHIVKSIGPFLRKTLKEEGLYRCRIQEISGQRDKPSKARSIQGRMEMRKVFFPTFAPWWPAAQHELLTAWSGAHDDFADCLSVIGRYLDKYQAAAAEPQVPKPDYFTLGWLKRETKNRELILKEVKSGY